MSEPINQHTLVLIKPDTLARRMAGRLITRLEDKEIDIMAMKMIRMDEKLAQQLYIQHKDKYFCPRLIRFTISGPVIVLVCRGRKVIDRIRQIIGEADPDSATPGTIRGDFSCHQTYNLIHSSDSLEAAAREIPLFFSEQELFEPLTADFPWQSYPEITENKS